MTWWSKHKRKPNDEGARPRWLAPHQTAFGIEVLDCRPLTQALVAVTADPDVAARFVTLRQSDGRGYVGTQPANGRVTACQLRYPFGGSERLAGPMFKAQEMEDKWDLYVYDDTLYCARSWTGDLIYSARIHVADGDLTIDEIHVAGDADEDPSYSIRALDYLIKSHLFKLGVPHPLPDARIRDPEQLAVGSFSRYGRKAWFGTFEETVGLPAVERVLWGRASN
jgi:hypothetical protein